MKALSIKQPYAELILQGKKKIELRKWNTKFRGEFFIHSPKSVDQNAMKKFGFSESKLPVGCIVGKVTLIEVKKYDSEEEHQKDNELHLASSNWGDYGFVLENPLILNKIFINGRLGFWEFDSESFKN